MNHQIKKLFDEYLLDAKDPLAAALLVLSDVLSRDPIIVETDDKGTVGVKEAAELLRTSSKKVYLACLSGRLRGRCVGGRVRIPIDEIERLQ
jgi:excisionase family DNA binding protein